MNPDRLMTPRRLLGAVSVGLVVLAAAASIGGWRAARADQRQSNVERFAVVSNTVSSRLQDAIARQYQSARDVAGLFSASEHVTRAEFAAYAEHVMPDPVGHAFGIGFAARVADTDLLEFVDEARAGGAPDFTVRPSLQATEHAIVLYNEPADPLRITWGSDAAGSRAVWPALQQSRDTGKPGLSEPVVLRVDKSRPAAEQPMAFVLYTPVYAAGVDPGTVAGRRAALVGWVSLPFRVQDLLAGLVTNLPVELTLTRTLESGPQTLATTAGAEQSSPAKQMAINVHGRQWTLGVAPAAGSTHRGHTPDLVLAAGLCATFLLGGLLLTLHTTSRRAQSAALEATRSLQRSEARLRATLAGAPDLILVVDADGTIASASDQALPVLGYEPAALVGQPVEILLPDSVRAAHSGHRLRFLANPRARAMGEGQDLTARKADGSLVPVEIALSPLNGESGDGEGGDGEAGGESVCHPGGRPRTPGQVIVVVRDVTARQSAHRALETYAADLERSNRDLEEFAYIASHDLSEPLRVVGGYTDLLSDRYGEGARSLDADASRYMTAITDGVDRMRLLIEGLLSFSRLRADQRDVGPVDLANVLVTVQANLEAALAECGAELRVGRLPVVCGDRGQITQLFQNLVANAAKFRSPDRPPVISIEAVTSFGRQVISVSDNGIGIEPEYHERIFAMFRRLHNRDRYEGTGIGLALCRRVVDLHGGDLTVASRPGEGSTFTFSLPASLDPPIQLPDGSVPGPAMLSAGR